MVRVLVTFPQRVEVRPVSSRLTELMPQCASLSSPEGAWTDTTKFGHYIVMRSISTLAGYCVKRM